MGNPTLEAEYLEIKKEFLTWHSALEKPETNTSPKIISQSLTTEK